MDVILYTYTIQCYNLQDSNEVEQFRTQMLEAYALYIIVILVFLHEVLYIYEFCSFVKIFL